MVKLMKAQWLFGVCTRRLSPLAELMGGHFGHPLNDFFHSNTFSEKQRREL